MSTSITHTVGLQEGNRDLFANSTATFSTMRVTIHTTGAWPNSPHSDNHVTILLILNEDKFIQLDMRADSGDRRGQLVWKKVDYDHSRSEIKFFDCNLGSPVQVKTLYAAIRYDWQFHQYLFSGGGSGCHFWKCVYARSFEIYRRTLTWRSYMLLRQMASDTNRFPLHPAVPDYIWSVFSKWYSLTGAERPNSILQGTFQTHKEWLNGWLGVEEEEEGE